MYAEQLATKLNLSELTRNFLTIWNPHRTIFSNQFHELLFHNIPSQLFTPYLSWFNRMSLIFSLSISLKFEWAPKRNNAFLCCGISFPSGQDFYDGQNRQTFVCTHIILSSVLIMTFETGNWLIYILHIKTNELP